MGKGFDPVDGLLGKNGLTTRKIARDLILLDLQRKIKTTSEYTRLFRVGQGTIQKAFKTLEETGAIALESRGHLGTYLTDRDIGRLWAVSGLGNVVGMMPLPDSKEFEGMASALTNLFADDDIPLNLLHLNGSRRRIECLKSGYTDFVVLSHFSANKACVNDPSLRPILTCGPNTYYAHDSLTVLARDAALDRRKNIGRVGIDTSSWDHAEITYLEFGSEHVELVEAPYHLIPDLILEGKIGAAVWHKSTRRIEAVPHSLRFLPLQSDTDERVADGLSHLALVGAKSNEIVRSLFGQIVDPGRLVRVQNEVIEGKRAPLF